MTRGHYISADYKTVWDKAYKNMTNDAEKFADKLTKLFKKAWKSGNGTDIGSAIAGWLNKGISWVNDNVDQFAKGAKKVAKLLATAINGFVAKLDWAGLGSAIGKSMKAAIEAETTFFSTVNWLNLGKAIATTLNAWIDTGVIQSYLKGTATKIRAAIELAFGAIKTFHFSSLGTALGQGINDAFAVMNKVNKKTGLNGWQELGQTISGGISGILTSISTALSTVKWDSVGQAIATAIGSIDFKGIVWNLGDVAIKILGALAEAIKGAFAQSPVETAIVTALGFIKLSTLTTKSMEKAATKILKVLGISLEKDETALTVLGGKIKGAIEIALGKVKDFGMNYVKPLAGNVVVKLFCNTTT